MNEQEESNKKQKTSNESTDFLNFDYDFPLDTTASGIPQENSSIPEDLFMFVTDTNDINTAPESSVIKTTKPIPQQQQQQQHQQQQKKSTEPPNQGVYTIVVGGKPFRLSWESLKSDGPSNFFVEYFKKKKTRVMHIDRDPDIFEFIVRHLRGYYIRSTDDIQNQSLLYDATYFGLNRLKKLLQEYLYLNVGGRVFRLPWTLFQKDGTHNFFTGPLMHSLLSPHTTEGNSPPIYIDRDPDIFVDIVNHLRGYTIHIRDEMHRKNLLKDAQYYVLRQLSDKILTAQQTVAGFGEGSNAEVLLLLQDVRVANMLPPKVTNISIPNLLISQDWSLTQIQYKRVKDGTPHALLVQVSDLCMQIHKSANTVKLMYEMNHANIKKMNSIANMAKATRGVNMEIYIDTYCAITIDDNQVKSIEYCIDNDLIDTNWEVCKKCDMEDCQMSRLILQRAICGVHLVDNMITLCALRLEAISSRFRLNLKREFLSG
ncbi:hypothetical protein MFLAVUS_007359 [Mucor flavus]|uniref:BTB domain-containing protein n=1 Tax=Mucor flavus TaxID=439312 RepID=A0ABP9Z431_9FUNG